MEKWQISLRRALTDPGELARRFGGDEDSIRRAAAVFPLRISPHFLSLIREAGDSLYRQCVPDERELAPSPGLLDDPLGEEARSPAPCIVHRYHDHCLFLVSGECATYCRFCTRKRRFCCGGAGSPSRSELASGIAWIAAHPEIRDVLVSGGDPLLLEDGEIDAILTALLAIPHVELVRIGTRVPCMLPERITRQLCRVLKKHKPLYVNVHFNHPDELAAPALEALDALADAGAVLGSQTVLLRGVNDAPQVMKRLMEKLLAARVRPYYLLQMDLIQGGGHFRTKLSTGVNIIDALRGHTSGLGVPHFIVDLPGGGGKVELVPQYLRCRMNDTVVFRNHRGEEWEYPELPQ